MKQRQIAYYYNGILKAEETEEDLHGLMRIPSEGEVLVRPGGKQWRVVEVIARHRDAHAAPVYLIYLTDSI